MRLSLFTRLVAAVIAPVLALAAILLYGFPHDTARLFAWPVRPPMTALVMGAGYLTGAAFFVQVMRSRPWTEVAPTLTGVAVFAPLMLGATLLHLDRFSQQHPAFFLWLGVYLVTPVLVPAVILHSRRREAGTTPDPHAGAAPGAFWRILLGVAFLILGGLAVLLYLAPLQAARIWPWPITPLSARVLGAWVATMSVGGLTMVRDPRRSAWRLTLPIVILWLALILIAVPRARESFDSSLAVLAFVVPVGGAWLLFVAAWVDLARRGRRIESVVHD